MSLYLRAPAATESAAQLLDLEWRAARRALAAQGADEATLAALDAPILDAPPTGNSVVAFAAHGSLLYLRRLPEPLAADHASVAAVPYVTPLLYWRQTRLPHVVVLADRTGAEILAYVDETEPVVSTEVAGSHDVIRRVQAGGWSQLRYQHRAEDSWAGNAKEVADDVDRVAERVGAELVLVGGDVHAVRLLREHLPERTAAKVEVLEAGGGRAADGGEPYAAAEILERVAAAAAARLRRVLDAFAEERGQGDRAADGVAETVAALEKAQVATLLVHDDPDDDRTLPFGPDASLVATNEETLHTLGVERPRRGRLTDVLVRAAVGTGADVVVVPAAGGPREGAGALLRYAG